MPNALQPLIDTMNKFIINTAFLGFILSSLFIGVLKGQPCTLDATLVSTVPALCNGTATGSVLINAVNGTPPYDFLVDGTGLVLASGAINNLFSAGNHYVAVRDATGCIDTVFFSISEPPPISLNVNVTPVICNGDDTGTGMAMVNGGTGSLTVTWQSCAGGPVFIGLNPGALFAGCYNVKVNDSNGCTQQQTVSVPEPPPFTFTSQQDSVDCYGGSNGSATIFVSGGTQPYTYLWDNGSTNQTATGLNANFHTVAITDSKNCQAFTFVQVLQPAVLKIDSVSVRAIDCFGQNNGKAAIYVSGGTSPYSYQWSDPGAQTTKQAVNLAAGLYTVTVSDYHGCSLANNALVPSPPDLMVSVTNLSGEKCAGGCEGTASIVASGGTPQYNIFWNQPYPPAGTFIASKLCAGAYIITVQDSKGCTKTVQAAISAATPIVVNLSGQDPSCAGALNGAINSNASGGVAPLSFKWSNGASTANLQNLMCGEYMLTVTDGNSCTQSDTLLLNCPPSINILNTYTVPATCKGGADGKAGFLALGGSGTLTYKWSDSSGQATPEAVNLTAGTYTVTVTDSNMCTNSSTFIVSEATAISNQFTPSPVNCFGGKDGMLSVQTNGGTGPYTYLWSTGESTAQISMLAAGNYTVTVTDQNACTIISQAPTILQPGTPLQITINQTKKSCSGSNNGSASAVASGSNGLPYNYVWDNGDVGQNAAKLSVGIHTVTVSDAQGCSATQSIQIEELDSIVINAAPLLPTCNGLKNGVLAVNLVNGGIGGGILSNYNYTWSVPNSPNNAVLNGLSGDQTYTVTVSDQQGCSGHFQFFLSQPPPITFDIQHQDVSCYGLNNGKARVFNLKNTKGKATFSWSTNATTDTLSGLSAGNYTLVVKDSVCCTQLGSVSILEPDSLTLHFTVKKLFCTNDKDASILAVPGGGTKPYQYAWSSGQMDSLIRSLATGKYILSLTDSKGCQLIDSVLISRPDSIVIGAEIAEPKCYGDNNGRIKMSVSGGKSPYKFRLNNNDFVGASTFIGLAAGIYNLEIKDANGCTASVTDTIHQPLPITIDLPPDTTLQLGQSLQIDASINNGVGMLELEWSSSLSDSLICIDPDFCTEILIKPSFSNRYSLLVRDENGCFAKNAIRVNVNKRREVYVPTGFSPDANNINDLLMVHGNAEQIKEIKSFRVYDRWGELMYEDLNFKVNDSTRGWDGRFRGKLCDPAVFVWYLEVEFLDGYGSSFSGNVTLIR